ncbi:hypothetical protein K503DRAFT_847156 [Rhizopogon vinicolor AM-OR11-026]|uniref:BHLH domain-containing protein n=1 Tax=Rhizopogon vinicolor AM-OR11-026 TaxID=1314800 RepID=A0A1B7NF53_9AGAM|nr:hypothetical protein K503DRAFT_847156 [Rhizopogon vinicolor AM-OR11-026]
MSEKRQNRVTRSTRAKQTSSQKTLYDLFQKDEETKLSEEGLQELDGANATKPEVPSSSNPPLLVDIIVIDDEPSPPRPKAPRKVIRGSVRANQNQPTNLFPIFGRPSVAPIQTAFSSSTPGDIGPSGDSVTELSDHEELRSSHQSSRSSLHLVPNSLHQSHSTPVLPCVEDINQTINGSGPASMKATVVGRRLCIPGDAHLPARRHVHSGDMVLDPPFPSQEMQHVRGPQSVFSGSSGSVPPKRCKRDLPDPTDDVHLTFLLSSQANECQYALLEPINFPRISSQTQREDYLGIHGPRDTAHHPAISKFLCEDSYAHRTTSAPTHQDIWTTRFRPTQANEVLGNESYALYIRDWLKALEIRLHDTNPPPAKNSVTVRGKPKGEPDPSAKAPKRPRVVRAVNKQRGRKRRRLDSEDELDAFLAHSDDEDENDIISNKPEEDVDDEDFIFCQRTLSRLQQKGNLRQFGQHPPTSEIVIDTTRTNPNYQTSDANFTDSLTNTLLITGPPGCGKSAAVYACAEELGWEVFEVYPGIGRRSGANLDNLVGDVGKNHLVHQVRPSRWKVAAQCDSMTSAASSTPFQKGGNANPKPSPIHSDTERPIDVDTHVLVDAASMSLQDTVEPPVAIDGPAASLKSNGPLKPSATARQSLILLEEVDILFKEDAGFWPSVVDLIKECRRPVIMTCNDIQLVPIADLPLQTVLRFQPCPSGPAVTFLQCLCLTEGYAIPREKLTQIYETTHTTQSMDLPDVPLNPRTEPLPLPDLRRSITQLQMICMDAIHEAKIPRGAQGTAEYGTSIPPTISAQTSANVSTTSTEEMWRWISNYTDCVSYTDSYLCRTSLESPEALSYNLSEPSLDDELGHAILFRPSHVSDTRDALAFYHNDEVIAQDAIHLARGKHEVLGTIPITTSINPAAGSSIDIGTSLFRARVVYQAQMLTALQDIIQPPAPLMPQSSVYLDYIPWVRFMVTVDDTLERLAWDEMEKTRSGRLTRNSMKAKHIRAIDLREDQHRAFARVMPASTTATIKHTNLHPLPKDTISSGGISALKDSASVSRHSPVISLPPLDYLQLHRRGSITDPSLHAASVNSSAGPRHIDGPRPAANYTFGDSGGSIYSSESSSKQMRKILRSPSAEREPTGVAPHTSHPPNGGAKTMNPPDQMNVDSSNERQSPRINSQQVDDFDYNSRRQSIANSSDSHIPHGTKRKTSSFREANGGDEADSQLVGPGVPSPMNLGPEGRAQKRRGSTIEMSRIAQLSIYDQRRHSVHSGSMGSVTGPGVAGGNGHWWLNERRDSLPPSFPNGTSGHPSAFSGDQPHGRLAAPSPPGSMATFAWSATQHPDSPQDPNIQHHPRSFDTQPMQMTMMPPMTFPPDRRMSVPDTSTSIGPTRNIRSRSRPPSRQLRETSQTAGPAGSAEDSSSAPSPPSSSLKPPKEPGSTPYSRSPELRVSHKLAERKRRKEMKDLFDELRDQLPADRGMKASKWEILSKAIDFVGNLKQSHQDMAREIEMLRHELESMRQGIPSFGPGGPPHAMVYGQGAPVPGPYPPPPGAISHPPPPHPHQPPPQPPPHPPQSRPPSSENPYPGGGTSTPLPQASAGALLAPAANGSVSIPANKSEVPPM